jgi:pSer/pThr/pTyr-binding forkhead associated (FHA) protein
VGQPTAELDLVEEIDTSPAARRPPCPACGAPRSGDDRYCEACGFDFRAPPAPATTWEAAVQADRSQFERLAAPGLVFPSDRVERRFALDAATVRIGRSRGQSGEQPPEIDLVGPLQDPGISRLHAALERQQDGSYAVRDLGSANGTTLNDDLDGVGTEAAVSLAEGDRLRLGAWTTIVLRRC